jgi:uncharacterized protein (UPF0210 family)
MPDYTTLSTQVDLFKTKVSALASTTLDANDLVLLASALDTLAKSMGVNDILSLTTERLAAITTATNAAITTINNSTNGNRITALENTSTSYETRIYATENYVSTAGGQISALSSTVTGLSSLVAGKIPNSWVNITESYSAVRGDRLLVTPAAGLVITLPAAPSIGDTVIIVDSAGTSQTTNFTIARNGSLIAGVAENLVFNVKSKSVQLVFSNTAQGWRVM